MTCTFDVVLLSVALFVSSTCNKLCESIYRYSIAEVRNTAT